MENGKLNTPIFSGSRSVGNSATSNSIANNKTSDVKNSRNSSINNSQVAMNVEKEIDLSSQETRVTKKSSSHIDSTCEIQNESTSETRNQSTGQKENEGTNEKQSESDKTKEDEIINLADDDDDDEVSSNTCEVYERQDRGYINNCMNPDCTSGVDLAPPAMFVLTYFNMKKCRDQFICAECFNVVVKHQEVIIKHVCNIIR